MPKIPSDHVFALVKSLSPNEKRYFKLYSSVGNNKAINIYQQLFAVMASMKKYDEKIIPQKIPAIKPQQLSNHKKYLNDLIIESLKGYNSQRSIESQLYSIICEIELLFDKRLFIQCLKKLKRGKELGYRYEKYLQLSALLIWEERILALTRLDDKDEKRIKTLFEEELFIKERMKNIFEYRRLHDSMLRFLTGGRFALNSQSSSISNRAIKHPLMQNTVRHISFRERYYHNTCKGDYFYLLQNWERCHFYLKQNVIAFESNTQFIKEDPVLYITTLSNFLGCCMNIGNHQEVEYTFQKVLSLRLDPAWMNTPRELYHFFLACNWMFHYFILLGKFQSGIILINQIYPMVNKFIESLDHKLLSLFYGNFAFIYFGVKKYKQTLFWLNKIRNEIDLHQREDILVEAYLFSLIVHFEMDNKKELDSLVKSIYRFLVAKNCLNSFEELLLDFFGKKIPELKSLPELRLAFKELKMKIDQVPKKANERTAFYSFDFKSWLNCKIENRDFADVVRENAKEK